MKAKGARSFDFTTTWGERDRTIRIVGSISPYYPAARYLRNGDPGYPAEGGEIEDLAIVLIHKRKDGGIMKRDVPDKSGKLAAALSEMIYEHDEP